MSATKDIFINDVYLPLLGNRDRYLVLYGGAGSGKSVFVAQKILLRLTSEMGHRFLVCRKVANSIEGSVFNELKENIERLGIKREFKVNLTKHAFTHLPTGNEIVCSGLDDVEKLKSISGISGIWIEEATELVEDDYNQLDSRLRGITPGYKQIFITFNPVDERHWLKKYFVDNKPKNCTVVHTTYRDNKFIDEEYRAVLESKAAVSPNFYRIYMLGEWGKPDVQRPYVHNFVREKHVSEVAMFNERLPVTLSFDFNVEPFACTMAHDWRDSKGPHIHWFKEISVENGDFEEMARRVRDTLPPATLASALYTGDATGRNRRLDTRPNVTPWKQIAQLLNIPPSRLKVPKGNPSVKDTRPLINLIFSTYPDLKIHPSLSLLINELQYTEADEEGNILKKDRNKKSQRADFLDTLRYHLTTFHLGYSGR